MKQKYNKSDIKHFIEEIDFIHQRLIFDYEDIKPFEQTEEDRTIIYHISNILKQYDQSTVKEYQKGDTVNDYVQEQVDNLFTEMIDQIHKEHNLPSGDWTPTQDIKLVKVMASITELLEEYIFNNSI